jgi:hypothetical protein
VSVDRYTSECTELCHFPDDNGKWVYYDDYRELEAERDRLIENISILLAQRKEAQHKSIAAMMEVATLRARHAALVREVDAVSDALFPGPLCARLKAALAEVNKI